MRSVIARNMPKTRLVVLLGVFDPASDLVYSKGMETDRPEPIPGQLDVWDCLEIAEKDGLSMPDDHEDRPKRQMTAAEVVASRLKET